MQDSPRLGSASQQGSCLWIGDLSTWMDENWLRRIFAPMQALVSCKVIRHKTTQMSRGYGFLLFNSPEAANQVLTQLNGTQIPGTDQVFRLNLAANGRQGSSGPTDFSLFVGDLSEEVTDFMLQEAFKQFYPSVRSAKVMRAPLSGKSRNFGFCRFASEQERDRALMEMNGHLQICGKPVRVSLATAKKTSSGLPALNQPGPGEADNTTLFVGGLSEHVTETELHNMFSLVGELASIKLLPSRGCAFVQFKDTAAAKAAITMLQKQVVAGSPIRINWGRQGAPAGRLPASLSQTCAPLGFAQSLGRMPEMALGPAGLGQDGLVPALAGLTVGGQLPSHAGLEHFSHQAAALERANELGLAWPGLQGFAGTAGLPSLGSAALLGLGQAGAPAPHRGPHLPSMTQATQMDLFSGYRSLEEQPPPFS